MTDLFAVKPNTTARESINNVVLRQLLSTHVIGERFVGFTDGSSLQATDYASSVRTFEIVTLTGAFALVCGPVLVLLCMSANDRLRSCRYERERVQREAAVAKQRAPPSFVFACGLHPRLGRKSAVRLLATSRIADRHLPCLILDLVDGGRRVPVEASFGSVVPPSFASRHAQRVEGDREVAAAAVELRKLDAVSSCDTVRAATPAAASDSPSKDVRFHFGSQVRFHFGSPIASADQDRDRPAAELDLAVEQLHLPRDVVVI